MTDRNTHPAPELKRCDTCGATEIDGNGNIKPLHGIPLCKRCRRGAQQLVKGNPEEWSFGEDGRLKRTGPEYDHVTRWKAEVAAITKALTETLDGLPVTIDVFHEHSGAAVVMPNGYRWHVYGPNGDPTGQGQHTVRLFTPVRRMTNPQIFIALDVDPDAAATQVLALISQSQVDGHPLREIIEEDALAEAEIALFNPDDLLKGTG